MMKKASVSLQLPYTCNNGKYVDHHRFGINKTLLSSDGRNLITAGRDGCIKYWNVEVKDPTLICSLDDHIDWVNDMILIGDKTLISASNDNTIMLWDLEEKKHSLTFRAHTDYVKCLSITSKTYKTFASGGLDGCIYIWDVEKLVAMSVNNSNLINSSDILTFRTDNGYYPRKNGSHSQKQSIYSIAINGTGTVLASGSSDKFIRVFDPRSGKRSFKLRGHQDNIRSVITNDEGTILVSGSSDNSIKYWDLRQQRCLHTYYVHDDSVWSLSPLVMGDVDRFVSGGRDQNVFLIDAKRNESTNLLHTNHPVLSMSITPDQANIWVSTTDSSISQYDFTTSVQRRQSLSFSNSFTLLPGSPIMRKRKMSIASSLGEHETCNADDNKTLPNVEPKIQIIGAPAIIKHHILNNRRQVLTKDSAGNVTLWDVTKGKLVENYGIVDFQEKIESLFEMQAIQNWFTVEKKLGCLEITLEYPQCFNAEVYAIEAGFSSAGEEEKVNYGSLMLRSLFSFWLEKYKEKLIEENKKRKQQEKEKKQEQQEEERQRQEAQKQEGETSQEADTKMKDKQVENSDTEETDDSTDDEDVLPPANDNFKFNVDDNLAVIIHHEKSANSSLAPLKKRIRDFDGTETPFEQIPKWVADNLIKGALPQAMQKVAFYLESCDDKLKNLPSQHSRLSAHRILRIRKVASYIIQKLEYELPTCSEFLRQKAEYDTKIRDSSKEKPQSNDEKVKPEEFLEILCNDRVLDSSHNLAIANAFYRDPRVSVITLHYRRRYPV